MITCSSKRFSLKYITNRPLLSTPSFLFCLFYHIQVSRYNALKQSRGHLAVPFSIKSTDSISSSPSSKENNSTAKRIRSLTGVLVSLLFILLLMIGVWFGKKQRKGTSLWIPPSVAEEDQQQHQQQQQTNQSLLQQPQQQPQHQLPNQQKQLEQQSQQQLQQEQPHEQSNQQQKQEQQTEVLEEIVEEDR